MESPGTSYYLLRWSDHVSNYAEMFLTLREQEEFVDCSIACEDGIVGAHRLVLAGCSTYMRDLLKHSNNPHPIIFLLDVSRSTILLLMEFIYRGQAHIPHSRLQQLVKLGKALKIKGLSQVCLPERYEPASPQIPRLHGYPDPVCEVEDVLDNRPNGSVHANNNTLGNSFSTPLPSEKDFPAGESTQKDMNSKEAKKASRNEIHNLSRNKEIASPRIFEGCESDSDKSLEERLVGGNNMNVSEMKNNMSSHTSNTVCSENVTLNQASASPKANYTPKPRSKQVTQEKNPKPSSENNVEKTQRIERKKNLEENSTRPKNKKNIDDKSASPTNAKKQLQYDQSVTPSKAKKSVESNHSSSPRQRDVTNSTKKRYRESSESSEERTFSPKGKKTKSSKGHPKVKPPVYKIKKVQAQSKSKLYSKKQDKIELAVYALKHGLEASQRYALTKYGVKVRSKSLEKLIAMHKAGLAKKKMKVVNNDDTPRRPVGRPRKNPLAGQESPIGSLAISSGQEDKNHQSPSSVTHEMMESPNEEKKAASVGSEFQTNRKRSLTFNVAGLFAKSNKSRESTSTD